jgi:hypothetical protein
MWCVASIPSNRALIQQVTALSLEKVNAGQASHRMSLLIDVEMGRPIEAEVRLDPILCEVTLTS